MIYTYDIIPPETEPEARAELINLVDTLNSVLAERDNYKRRAEALEKALLESCEYGACEFCEHERKEDISCTLAKCADKNNKHFHLDEARIFTGGDGE